MYQFKNYVMVILAFVAQTLAAEPAVFLSKKDAQQIYQNLRNYPVLQKSFQQVQVQIDRALTLPIEVPPPGEAGGYEHEKHKQNAREIQQAGLLYLITGQTKYAEYAKNLLQHYAELYPSLGKHPLSHDQAPGKLFHQMLNETVWLVNTIIGYDCIADGLKPNEREFIEINLFRPMLVWFTQTNAPEMNRIHNHGTWTVAAVGLAGYVLKDSDLIQKALYGTNKDGNGGFLAQLDRLFSPDGYYMEGPYYIRYALQPFFIFAEAIERCQPELRIFAYRDSILQKAYLAALQTTLPNGVFAPINDASRSMDYTDAGVVLATDIAYYRFGRDKLILSVAQQQNEVILHSSGWHVARDLSKTARPKYPNWSSIEFTDGADGKQGGLAILRYGKAPDQTVLLLKYGVHGEGHGHFDKLHFIFFDQGREVIPDYGYARWINIEPKFGGRYLPENKSYAMQTIAHNTVVVDESCQNEGNRQIADRMAGERHFCDFSNPNVQVVSARARGYYPGVDMQRTMFLIKQSTLEFPVVIDLFLLQSEHEHVYDYPIHFNGQLIATNIAYQSNSSQLVPLGTRAGYQHIWKEAQGQFDKAAKVTWLDGQRYYSLLISGIPGSEMILGRLGANDPNFNLRSAPLMLFRQRARQHLFAAILEPHGYFNEAKEISRNARGSFQDIKIVGFDATASVIEIFGANDFKWRVVVFNGTAASAAHHSVVFNGREYNWSGNYQIDFKAD